MNRRGNYHDDAAADGFFQLLKWERIRPGTDTMWVEGRQDVFDYVYMSSNRQRRHGFNDKLSPINYKRKRYFERLGRSGKP
jgi:putative transposase